MADWYCSSVSYTAVAQFAITHAYVIGDLIRQLATPTVGNERVFRCTTAGTTAGSEPSWTLTKGGTTSSGTAVFTEVTGNSTYNWAAPHARMENAIAWMASNERIFVSSDHTQTTTATKTMGLTGTTPQAISVNKAGSVPPVAADITPGASIAVTGGSSHVLGITGSGLWDGFTFVAGTSTESNNIIQIGQSNNATLYLLNCQFLIGGTGGSNTIQSTGSGRIVFDNTPFKLLSTSDNLSIPSTDIEWINTSPGFVSGTAVPTNGINTGAGGTLNIQAVDLSALTGSLFFGAGGSTTRLRVFDCKLASGVTILKNAISSPANSVTVDVINCDNGANYYKNSWHRYSGSIVTDASTQRSGGASDGVTPVSHKYVSLSGATVLTPLIGPDYMVWATATGVSKTVTMAIISSAALNNNDIWLEVVYLGSSGSPQGSVVQSYPATPLTAASAVPTDSGSTWNSPPATPALQSLSVSFTPQAIGLYAVRVKLGKASTTVWVDPLIQVT